MNEHHDATLHFFGGQLLFEYKDFNGAVIKKCISPGAARSAFTDEPIDSDWLPPESCRYGEGPKGAWIMLKYEPARYEVSLAEPLTIAGHATPLTLLSVPLPAVLFLGIERNYFLWAFKAWKESATALYHVPLPNVHPTGAICFGNTTPPIASGKTIQRAWTIFWESQFSNELTSGKSRAHRDNVLLHLADLHQQAQSYPTGDLVRANITMPHILKQLTESRNGHLE
ncbi:MAG: hypothetical protein KGS09_18575 [Nitrospirae bacterium]|nr:hypothetical protein [Nitrospirota bacterium]MDE3038982.1 hypothetical protein [Nitrospirota bacterium]MDE3220896.1 hypothetical protein [Nitrospirota bacterium]